jgi:hypothetical protein
MMPFWLVKPSTSPDRNPLSIFTVAPLSMSPLSGSLTCRVPSSVAGEPPKLKVAALPAVTLGGVCTTWSVLVAAVELSRLSFTT